MSVNDTTEPTRRDFLYIATGMAGVVAVGGAVWPFIDQMRPDASTLALATIDVDISDEELKRRRSEWTVPESPRLHGVLGKYAKLVHSASEGAVCY